MIDEENRFVFPTDEEMEKPYIMADIQRDNDYAVKQLEEQERKEMKSGKAEYKTAKVTQWRLEVEQGYHVVEFYMNSLDTATEIMTMFDMFGTGTHQYKLRHTDIEP